ncbi:MAG TPA: hypothetical protein VME24_01435 [Alphaproteobacteria bacterium]|nr:hypothetical protein [Alphaproteobacteria bacterium]
MFKPVKRSLENYNLSVKPQIESPGGVKYLQPRASESVSAALRN